MKSRQNGAVLVVSLILLTLITVLVASAFTASSVNTRAVGNMQFRGEAIAAANQAIERVLASPFTDAPSAEAMEVDIDNNGVTDYEVAFAVPTCLSATAITTASAPPSSLSLGTAFSVAGSTFYQTVWDLDATVTHAASGTSVRVRHGVRVLLTQAQFNTVCT
jgi:type II secretory pathway component PulK